MLLDEISPGLYADLDALLEIVLGCDLRGTTPAERELVLGRELLDAALTVLHAPWSAPRRIDADAVTHVSLYLLGNSCTTHDEALLELLRPALNNPRRRWNVLRSLAQVPRHRALLTEQLMRHRFPAHQLLELFTLASSRSVLASVLAQLLLPGPGDSLTHLGAHVMTELAPEPFELLVVLVRDRTRAVLAGDAVHPFSSPLEPLHTALALSGLRPEELPGVTSLLEALDARLRSRLVEA